MPLHPKQSNRDRDLRPDDETIVPADESTTAESPPAATPPLRPSPPNTESGFSDTTIDNNATLIDADSSGYPSTPVPSSTTRRRFGDYELIREIARGGMGVVYRARQPKLNRDVALKMILSGELASPGEIERFYREAEAAANLEHPGIIPIFEIGEIEGQHFFSMALVEGHSLAERLKEGPIAPREAVEITKKVSEAIAYAHRRNVIHRDLKPANVLIDYEGQPKVTDFGLAKQTEASAGLTATGQIIGTPSFMPPEQASGRVQEVDARSDVYSLGALLYALLTGRAPFQAASVMDTLKQVIEQEPVPPRRLNSVIHSDLEIICLKCLSKSQESRYQSADALVDELDRFLNGQPIQAKPSTVLARTWSTVISETRHTEVLAMWSRVWWWHAGLVFVLFMLTSVLQWFGAPRWTIAALWVPGLAALVYAVWHYRIRDGGTLTPLEKQVSQVWGLFAVTAVLTGIVNHLMGLDTMQLLPVVALQCGLAFCCMAAILGGSFYPMGIACFVLGVLMTFIPTAATLVFGIMIGIGLLIPAIRYAEPSHKE